MLVEILNTNFAPTDEANLWGMNDRIKRLRKETFEAEPSQSVEQGPKPKAVPTFPELTSEGISAGKQKMYAVKRSTYFDGREVRTNLFRLLFQKIFVQRLFRGIMRLSQKHVSVIANPQGEAIRKADNEAERIHVIASCEARCNPEYWNSLDCFVASLLAMTETRPFLDTPIFS
jgi:hypothetical protein